MAVDGQRVETACGMALDPLPDEACSLVADVLIDQRGDGNILPAAWVCLAHFRYLCRVREREGHPVTPYAARGVNGTWHLVDGNWTAEQGAPKASATSGSEHFPVTDGERCHRDSAALAAMGEWGTSWLKTLPPPPTREWCEQERKRRADLPGWLMAHKEDGWLVSSVSRDELLGTAQEVRCFFAGRHLVDRAQRTCACLVACDEIATSYAYWQHSGGAAEDQGPVCPTHLVWLELAMRHGPGVIASRDATGVWRRAAG